MLVRHRLLSAANYGIKSTQVIVTIDCISETPSSSIRLQTCGKPCRCGVLLILSDKRVPSLHINRREMDRNGEEHATVNEDAMPASPATSGPSVAAPLRRSTRIRRPPPLLSPHSLPVRGHAKRPLVKRPKTEAADLASSARLDTLPAEVLVQVVALLDLKHVSRVARVCTALRACAGELWKRRVMELRCLPSEKVAQPADRTWAEVCRRIICPPLRVSWRAETKTNYVLNGHSRCVRLGARFYHFLKADGWSTITKHSTPVPWADKALATTRISPPQGRIVATAEHVCAMGYRDFFVYDSDLNLVAGPWKKWPLGGHLVGFGSNAAFISNTEIEIRGLKTGELLKAIEIPGSHHVNTDCNDDFQNSVVSWGDNLAVMCRSSERDHYLHVFDGDLRLVQSMEIVPEVASYVPDVDPFAGVFDVGGQLLVAWLQLVDTPEEVRSYDQEPYARRLAIRSVANGTTSTVRFRPPMCRSRFRFVTDQTQLLVMAEQFVYSFAPCGILAWSIAIKDDIGLLEFIGVDGTDIYLAGEGVYRLSHDLPSVGYEESQLMIQDLSDQSGTVTGSSD
eukprot:TRINITY_DN1565_c0_g6_i1.p1 TRINITY_DN1565_c0_g6~~TRINITY_DN1565_c0_g6_i1.p1  ORF type:complete len:567 (-),score=57.80 TRINITY_DN1565_c0_g6_i1:328-2028(-)